MYIGIAPCFEHRAEGVLIFRAACSYLLCPSAVPRVLDTRLRYLLILPVAPSMAFLYVFGFWAKVVLICRTAAHPPPVHIGITSLFGHGLRWL